MFLYNYIVKYVKFYQPDFAWSVEFLLIVHFCIAGAYRYNKKQLKMCALGSAVGSLFRSPAWCAGRDRWWLHRLLCCALLEALLVYFSVVRLGEPGGTGAGCTGYFNFPRRCKGRTATHTSLLFFLNLIFGHWSPFSKFKAI